MDDDIPEFIEDKGEKIPIDKENYRSWQLNAANRILMFSQMEPLRTKMDGKLISIFDPREFIKIDADKQGTTINIDKPGLKTKEGLIGLGGNYYIPYYLGAKDSEDVTQSWDWIFEYMKIPKKDFETFLEFVYILDFISTGQVKETIFRIMSFAVDMKYLFEVGVDVKRKTTEVAGKIKGNMRSFNKNKGDSNGRAIFVITLLTRELSDFFAESRLARFAKSIGLDIVIDKSPDILINDVRIEVKYDRRDRMDMGGFVNKIKKGLEQNGDMIAIFTGSFEKKNPTNMKITWFPIDSLKDALIKGLSICKNKKKCILLFTSSNKGYYARLGIIR